MLNAFDPSLSNGAMMDIGVCYGLPDGRAFRAAQAVDAQGVVLSSGRTVREPSTSVTRG